MTDNRYPPWQDDTGSTLVELLVSMVLFATAMALIMGAALQVMRVTKDSEGAADATFQTRQALALIDRQVRSGNVLFSPADEVNYISSGCQDLGTNQGFVHADLHPVQRLGEVRAVAGQGRRRRRLQPHDAQLVDHLAVDSAGCPTGRSSPGTSVSPRWGPRRSRSTSGPGGIYGERLLRACTWWRVNPQSRQGRPARRLHLGAEHQRTATPAASACRFPAASINEGGLMDMSNEVAGRPWTAWRRRSRDDRGASPSCSSSGILVVVVGRPSRCPRQRGLVETGSGSAGVALAESQVDAHGRPDPVRAAGGPGGQLSALRSGRKRSERGSAGDKYCGEHHGHLLHGRPGSRGPRAGPSRRRRWRTPRSRGVGTTSGAVAGTSAAHRPGGDAPAPHAVVQQRPRQGDLLQLVADDVQQDGAQEHRRAHRPLTSTPTATSPAGTTRTSRVRSTRRARSISSHSAPSRSTCGRRARYGSRIRRRPWAAR